MSIFLAMASRGPIANGVAPPTSATIFQTAAILVWLLLAYFAAKLLGAFRPRSIVGPPRLAPNESVWSLVFFFFAGVFIAISLAKPVNRFLAPSLRTNVIVQSAILESIAILCIVACMHLFRPRGIQLLGLRPIQIPRGIAIGATTLFILFPIVLVVGVLTQILLNWAGVPVPTHEVLQALGERQSGPVFYVTIALAVLGAPLAEELAFRGVVQTTVARGLSWIFDSTDTPSPTARPRWVAVIITSLLFAAVHHEWAFFPPLFVLSLGLGYLYERSGNLWATIAMHALFNSIEIVIFLGALSH